jgi:hypothetical protein
MKIQIKTAIRYHFTPVMMNIMKNTRDKCLWECGEKGIFVHCGDVYSCSCYGKQCRSALKS